MKIEVKHIEPRIVFNRTNDAFRNILTWAEKICTFCDMVILEFIF